LRAPLWFEDAPEPENEQQAQREARQRSLALATPGFAPGTIVVSSRTPKNRQQQSTNSLSIYCILSNSKYFPWAK